MNSNFIITPIRYLRWKKTIKDLICNNIYIFNDVNRKLINKNDHICFYVAKKGVCAHAIISSDAKELKSFDGGLKWEFKLDSTHIYYNNPNKISEDLRSDLDAFNGKDVGKWSWFVQTTRYITENDFKLLIREDY